MGQLKRRKKNRKVNLQILKVYINQISHFDLLLCYTPILPKIFPGDCWSHSVTNIRQLKRRKNQAEGDEKFK